MKRLILAASIALLTACNSPPPATVTASVDESPAPTVTTSPVESLPQVSEPTLSSTPVAIATPEQAAIPSDSAATGFNFPQPTCGDEATGENDTWYPVFIDGGNLAQIRSQYCADAVATTREATRAKTVQLASFTSQEKASRFASAVRGEVGVPNTPDEFVDLEESTVTTTTTTTTTPPVIAAPVVGVPSISTSSGRCDRPDQLDSAGRRCGGRAADTRRGGRGRR